MDIGINNHLKRISSDLFIKNDAEERIKIEKSIDSIISRLKNYFGNQVNSVVVFGSYTRDTILPRQFDPNSDVDILIQFNTDNYDKLKSESYRSKLKKFSEINYPNSRVVKDHPSIVIELNHIKCDLVPSIFDRGFFYDSIEIPDKNGGWMETKPTNFNEKLILANGKYNFIVKPIIRLLKYWNASRGYPYYSYDLENVIADMDFRNDNYESGFLYCIDNLTSYDLPDWAARKVESLKNTAEYLENYLERGEIQKAKKALEKILPRFGV